MNKIKALVSKKKRRFQRDGFDLDLSYVTDRLIAMGFPSEGVEGMYRNDMEHVRKFLAKFHDRHYKIYNLCSERAYPPKLFRNSYAAYPFDDHGPCSFEMLLDFCEDAYKYLQRDKQNIIVAHCKAGKGRTGTVLAALLLFDKTWSTAAEALQYFAVARTANQKGVTIPSQVRYVHYMEKYLKCYRYVDRPFNFAGKPMRLVGFCLMHLGRECTPWFVVSKEGDYDLCNFRKENKQLQTWSKDSPVHLLRCDVVIEGDTHVLFYVGDLKKKKKKKLCGFWINTSFVHSTKMLFTKDELDVANKDKSCPKNFQVEAFFAPLPGTKNVFTCTCNSPNPCHPGYDGAELVEYEREAITSPTSPPVSSPSSTSEKDSKGKGKKGLKNLSTPFTPKHPGKEPFSETLATIPKGGMQNSERVTGTMLPAVMGSMNLPKAPARAPPVAPPSALSSDEVTKNSTLAPQLDDFYAYVRRATEAPTKPESKYAQTRCAEKGCDKERAPMGGAYCDQHRPTGKSPPPLRVGALSPSPKGPSPISPKPVVTPTTTTRTVQFQPPSSPVKGTQAPPPGSKIPVVAKSSSKSEIIPSSPTPEEDKKKDKSRLSALFGAKPTAPTAAPTPAPTTKAPTPAPDESASAPPMPRRAPPGPPPARPPPASPTEEEDYEPPNEEEDDDEPEASTTTGSPAVTPSTLKPITVDEDEPPPPPPGEGPEGDEEEEPSDNEEEDVTDEEG